MTENCAQGEPMVRPRRSFTRWRKHFRCTHHWIWVSPGDGRTPWFECGLCRWSYIDPCDKYGHKWDRIDSEGQHWFECRRIKCKIARRCRICADGTIVGFSRGED